MRINYLFILIIMSALTGCSFFSPVATPTTKYLLNAIPGDVPVKRTRTNIILVSTPEASQIFNTSQMAYTTKPYQISYYSENEWAATPAQMLQPLLAQTLENTHYFKAVVTPPYAGQYDFLLNTEILALTQDFTCPIPRFVMSVRVQLIKVQTNKIVGTKEFIVRATIRQRTPYAGVYAGNRATAEILQEIAEYSLSKVR